MHRDSKERRRRVMEISEKMTHPSKHVSGDVLKRFREVPYQLRCGKGRNMVECMRTVARSRGLGSGFR